MKLDAWIIITKGACHLAIGVFTPWTVALAQWINTGGWPERIVWIGVIVPASVIGGASALLAFLSGSYKTYREGRNVLPPTP